MVEPYGSARRCELHQVSDVVVAGRERPRDVVEELGQDLGFPCRTSISVEEPNICIRHLVQLVCCCFSVVKELRWRLFLSNAQCGTVIVI